MTDRKNLNNAVVEIELMLEKIETAAAEIYKIKNILTAANSTGQIVTEEAAKSAIWQYESQLSRLASLITISASFAYELNAEATANAVIA